MKAIQARNQIEQAIEVLNQALKQGNSRQLTDHLVAITRFHQYSFSNAMLIAIQCPDASYVAGFNAWKKINRFVKKGEQGITIIAPVVRKSHEEGSPGEKRVCGYRAVRVFDISQTDGEPMPEIGDITGNPGGFTKRLRDLVGQQGITLEYSHELGAALGRSTGGAIVLAAGLEPAAEFGTLVHELAHEMLHHGGKPTSKTVCETEAEAVAFVVSHSVGLDAVAASTNYIRLYQGDCATLSASLQRIQRTAAKILKNVQPNP